MATERRRLDIDHLAGSTFEVDAKPGPRHEAAFRIYLLGHDDVARHRITFARRNPDGSWPVEWRGDIRLAYGGERRYAHSFAARIESAYLEAVFVTEWSDEVNARRALRNVVVDDTRYAWRSDGARPCFVLTA